MSDEQAIEGLARRLGIEVDNVRMELEAVRATLAYGEFDPDDVAEVFRLQGEKRGLERAAELARFRNARRR